MRLAGGAAPMVLWLCVAAGAVHAQPATPDHRVVLARRHLVLFVGLERVLEVATRRAARDAEVMWERVARVVRAAGVLDGEYTYREKVLEALPGATPREAELEAELAARRAEVVALLRGLADVSAVPLPGADTFVAPKVPAIAGASQAAQVRLKVRTVPVGSVDALFGATATVPAAALPHKR